MNHQDNRVHQRSDINLIVNFRHPGNTTSYSLGITNNLSLNGLCLESSSLHFNPGDPLDLLIRHPQNQHSLSASGNVVWHREGWYKATAGVRFLPSNDSSDSNLDDLISAVRSTPMYASFFNQNLYQTEGGGIPPSRAVPEKEHLPGPPGCAAPVQSQDDNTNSTIHSQESLIRPEELLIRDKKRNTPSLYSVTALLIILAAVIFPLKLADLDRQPSQMQGDVHHQDSLHNTFDTPEMPSAMNAGHRDDHLLPLNTEETAIRASDQNADSASPDNGSTTDIAAVPPTQHAPWDITFPLNSDAISADFFDLLDKVAAMHTLNPEMQVKIEGHADSQGPEVYNLDLALRRALAVKESLHKRGIDRRSLNIIVYGDSSPIASNQTIQGRMKNRRVRVLLVNAGDIPS